jgi:tetratricopeptide (TPR) repeat protein
MTAFRKAFLALVGLALLAPMPAWAQTEDATRILNQASGGVVALVMYGQDKAEFAKASAMALTEDILATAYHVVSQAYNIEAVNAKGKKMKIDGIVGVDRALDIVLLKLKGKVQPLTVSVSGPEALAEGARLFALGSNESGQIVVSEGTLRRFVDAAPDTRAMELSLSVPKPFCGGPILGLSGNVQGMVVILDDRVRIGLPISAIQKVSRSDKVADFKSWNKEDYFSLAEGAAFAGRAAAALDELSAAKMHLEKAVKLDPAFVDGYELLAGVYDRQRDNSAAIRAYRKVTELDPKRAAAFYGLGEALKRTGSAKEAVEALEQAVALNFDNKEIYFELGDCYETLQDWNHAAASYEKFLSLKPEVTWNGYLRLGFCRNQLQQYDAAIAAYLEALKSQPKDVKVNYSLAEAYEKAGQLEKAEEIYNTLARINPSDAESYYRQVIRMYDGAEQFDRAAAAARKIVDLDPKNTMNVYNLGLMYLKMKNYDEAIAAFKQCVAVKPDFATAWVQLGSAYFNQKKYREAIEPYKKYTELMPDDPVGWLNVGVSYMFIASATKSAKDFEMALAPMKKAVDLKPDNANALYNLAIVYLNLKDKLSAQDIYKKLAALDPALAERLKKYLK